MNLECMNRKDSLFLKFWPLKQSICALNNASIYRRTDAIGTLMFLFEVQIITFPKGHWKMNNSTPLFLFLLLLSLFLFSSSNSSSRCDINSEKLHVQGTAISRTFRRTSDLQVSKLVMKIFRKFHVPRFPSWEQSRSI